MSSKFSIVSLLLISLIFSTSNVRGNEGEHSIPIEGRFSFSLSTFDPSGTIPQLSHASKAAMLGPPIVAFTLPPQAKHNERGHDQESHRQEDVDIILASPQFLPSPLVHDDGTSRFVKITDSIVVGHTGVNADGRVVTEAAQRLAVEHAYTFREEIPLDVLLEEIALLFQKWTMKPGARPFGCSLLVVSIGQKNDYEQKQEVNGNGRGKMYRIDPSGSVTELKSMAYLGRGDGERIMKRFGEEFSAAGNNDIINRFDNTEQILMKILGEEMGLAHNEESSSMIVCTRLSRKKGFVTKRIPLKRVR